MLNRRLITEQRFTNSASNKVRGLKRPTAMIPRPFKSSIDSAVWKKMTPAAREAHKVRQAEHKAMQAKVRASKRKPRLKLILNKYPRGYKSVYRKIKLYGKVSALAVANDMRADYVKKKIKLIIRNGMEANSAFEIYAWQRILDIKSFKAARGGNKLTRYSASSRRLAGLFEYALLSAVNQRQSLGTSMYCTTTGTSSSLKENAIIKLYSNFAKELFTKAGMVKLSKAKAYNSHANYTLEKRGYIKHIVRMRYRWFFQPRLSQFKLFKKFFKRSLKRYRKINKNRLFISKFRSHFPKLTGFTEKGLLKLWLPFRRNYNQYWATNNAVLRFSQSLLLAPVSLLVFLQLSPSFAASKYIIKSGAVSINGLSVAVCTQFKPGDIMQLNFIIWKSVQQFFDYQRWNNDLGSLQYLPFLQVDWSSLMFMMVRWPRKYELVAPSFLSERWIRYYVRQFPSKIRTFRKAGGNWKVYKRITAKR